MQFAVSFMYSEVTASHSGLGIVSKNTTATHCAKSPGIVTQRYTRPEVVLPCEENRGRETRLEMYRARK